MDPATMGQEPILQRIEATQDWRVTLHLQIWVADADRLERAMTSRAACSQPAEDR